MNRTLATLLKICGILGLLSGCLESEDRFSGLYENRIESSALGDFQLESTTPSAEGEEKVFKRGAQLLYVKEVSLSADSRRGPEKTLARSFSCGQSTENLWSLQCHGSAIQRALCRFYLRKTVKSLRADRLQPCERGEL